MKISDLPDPNNFRSTKNEFLASLYALAIMRKLSTREQRDVIGILS